MKASVLIVLAVLHCLAAHGQSLRLDAEIARVSRITDGTVGVSAVHLETGRRVNFNADGRYPMASTFKVPIAVQLLSKIDRGEVRLDQMVEVQREDLHPGSGTLTHLFKQPGVALSVRNLMELMLLISDNSATDMLLRLAGGADAVTAKMRELGIEGIRVDRSTKELIGDWIAAPEKFEVDPKDTAQPRAMVALLERIYRKDLHKPASAELLLDIMGRCETGDARLKGMLPAGTAVAHKTGTIGGTVDDIGIVTLPGDAGHVAIAAFVKSARKPMASSEKAIAEVARAVYDYFLFVEK